MTRVDKRQSAIRAVAIGWMVAPMLFAGQPARADDAPACNPADARQTSLLISVTGMRSTKGNVIVTIYPDDAPHFLDGAYKLARQQLPVTLPATTTCFVLPAPGYYAVALFHDENDNHHFDTSALGIPTEGYGFSNNPTLYLGPPALGRVRFSAHQGSNPVAITMKYY